MSLVSKNRIHRKGKNAQGHLHYLNLSNQNQAHLDSWSNSGVKKFLDHRDGLIVVVKYFWKNEW